MYELAIAEHAMKHGLTQEEIAYAWEHLIAIRFRKAPNEEEAIAIGILPDGSVAEVVALTTKGRTVIFHAMTPPTRKALIEVGLKRR
jgi:uncharacterized DUF497 family protein